MTVMTESDVLSVTECKFAVSEYKDSSGRTLHAPSRPTKIEIKERTIGDLLYIRYEKMKH